VIEIPSQPLYFHTFSPVGTFPHQITLGDFFQFFSAKRSCTIQQEGTTLFPRHTSFPSPAASSLCFHIHLCSHLSQCYSACCLLCNSLFRKIWLGKKNTGFISNSKVQMTFKDLIPSRNVLCYGHCYASFTFHKAEGSWIG